MMIERRYKGARKPLKKALSELFPEITYSELQACLRRRDVKVDGARASSDSFLIGEGAVVAIYPRTKRELTVLYENEDILACYKPKGIASEGEASFESWVRAAKGDVRLTHRLDTNTDGVILFAKSEEAYQEIYSAMKEGLITKRYLAEVYGHPPKGKDILLEYYYQKDAEKGRASISDTPKHGYLPVHISYTLLEEKKDSSLLLVELHKGKTHQIRAMLAHYGYFILGDGKYGSDRVNRELGVKKTLLTAISLSFSFHQHSPLAYLNEVEISLK